MTAYASAHVPNRDARGKFASGSTGESQIEDFGGKTTPTMSDAELADMHHDDDPNREVGSWNTDASAEAPF